MTTIKEYSEKIGIPTNMLKGESRKRTVSVARQVYWYYLFQNGVQKKQICGEFNRKHSTVLEGIRKVEGYIDVGDKIINPYLLILGLFHFKNE